MNPNLRSENSVQIIMILIFKIHLNIIYLSRPEQLLFRGFQLGFQFTKETYVRAFPNIQNNHVIF